MKLPGEKDIEIVSNENGIAYKFKNGLMIVTQRYEDTINKINNLWGQVYSAETSNPPQFPVNFVEIPTISRSVEIESGGNVWLGTTGEKNSQTRSAKFNLFRGTASNDPTTITVNIVAIGKWK